MEKVIFMYGSKETLCPTNEHIRKKRSRIGAWADLQWDYPRSTKQIEIPENLEPPEQDNRESL